ncbi:MAG: choice-of-anchor J domain-containing protein, partial [Kiritimatiellae bacterium]|nr:choice-of-anchor J domain-containing protein [Kiritimatiellia bacterium]
MTGVKKRLACWVGLAALLASLSQAAPFARRISFTQPDGREITLWGEGDEFHADFETLDGYTVTFDPGTMAYVYAGVSADGADLVPTALVVGRDNPAALGLAKHLRVTPESARQKALERRVEWDERVKASQRWQDLKAQKALREAALNDGPVIMAPPTFETVGEKVGLCLLVDFDDDPATVPRDDIVEFCNGDNYTGYGNNGSVKEYYADVSKNQLNFTHVVTVYIHIPNSLHPKSYYNDINNDAGENARRLINDAVAIMKALPEYETEILPTFANLTTRMVNENMFGIEFPVDFEAVAACSVFYAGGNGGVWSKGLWPHYSMLGLPIELSDGGLRLMNYQVTDIGSSLEIATFAHENGHMLCGFPDIYDYDVPQDSSGGAGLFCLMNSGTFYGRNPPQFCAYLKHVAGWATTVDVTYRDGLLASVAALPEDPDFNKFYRYEKPGTPAEYFLFENRQQTGRDANIPASGVAVWHIDELGDRDNQSLAYNDSHKNYECTLVQADNRWDLQMNINDGDATDLYYAGNPAAGYVNALTPGSAPGSRWWDGTDSLMYARHFSTNGTVMTFRFVPPPPVMLRKGVLPPGWIGTYYNLPLNAVDGIKPYTWQIIAGVLPAGLALDPSGAVTGMPVTVENAAFTLVVYGDGASATTNDCSIAILPNPALPFTEDFENGGNLPDAWAQAQASGAKAWEFVTGSPNGSPVNAHGGIRNACLYVNTMTQAVTRLISPMLDFGDDAKAARVTFWHHMERWSTGQDELRVYYKTSWAAEWEPVATYAASVISWTQRTIDLPAPSRTAYLAFEGTARYGYGVCVDDVAVWDPTPPLGITNADPLTPAVIEAAYTNRLAAEGGVPPYTYAIIAGGLPTGFSMDAEGLITGLSSNVQSSSFTVRVTDGENATADKALGLAVVLPRADLFAEDFERGGLMPFGWTQEYVTDNVSWSCYSGGYNRNPLQAQSGSFNAFLFTEWSHGMPDKKTRLVSPFIDLGQAPGDIRLSFWHCMKAWEDGQDELRVFYKRSDADTWHLLATYTANVPVWTERTMLLPEPTSTYRIAFEGNARSGYGVCVDNVRITAATDAPLIRTGQTLPSGLTALEYSTALEAAGGTQPYSWAVVSNALPAGLSLGADDGVISGQPTAPGLHYFSVRVAGADGKATTNLFTLRINIPTPMPFSEDFEHGGALPEGWTQVIESGAAVWVARSGSQVSYNRTPAAAHSGQYNAYCFYPDTGLRRVKLITPMINLGNGTPNTKLSFWHCMAPYYGYQDKLRVYYRTSSSNDWVEIARFEGNTSSWTQRTVDLPEPTPTYYIAFEGHTTYGYGVCIDDIQITGDFSPYLNWQANYFSEAELAEGVITADDDDPDGDGIPNAL